MSLSRRFIKELRALEKIVGRAGIWGAAEEAEKNLPKRGREPGPIYSIEQAVARMRALKAAAPSRSWRDISKEVAKEFPIAAETLRIEERKRRQAPDLAEPTSPRRRVISRPSAEDSFSYADYIKMVVETHNEIEREVERQRQFEAEVERTEKATRDLRRLIDELVGHPDWRDILRLEGLGKK